MLSKETQDVITRIIAERIAFLAETIRTGNEASAMAAAMRLGAIGTKHSDQVAIELLGQLPEVFVKDMFSETPIYYFANEKVIRKRLEELRKDVPDFNAKSAQTGIDPRVLALPPLWKTIAKALEYEFAPNKSAGFCGTKPINWPD